MDDRSESRITMPYTFPRILMTSCRLSLSLLHSFSCTYNLSVVERGSSVNSAYTWESSFRSEASALGHLTFAGDLALILHHHLSAITQIELSTKNRGNRRPTSAIAHLTWLRLISLLSRACNSTSPRTPSLLLARCPFFLEEQPTSRTDCIWKTRLTNRRH